MVHVETQKVKVLRANQNNAKVGFPVSRYAESVHQISLNPQALLWGPISNTNTGASENRDPDIVP